MSENTLKFMNKTEVEFRDELEDDKSRVTAEMIRGDDSRNSSSSSRLSPPTQVNGQMSPSQVINASGKLFNNVTVGKRGRKTDREREETGGRREWTDTEITILITLWRDNDILYDTNHPLYYVQSERKLVMDYMGKEMNISVRDVNDKMHSLRTYYCSQRQRTESLDAKGGNSRAFPRWKFYDQMSFLYESVTNRAVKSSLSSTRRGRKPRDEQPTPPDQQQQVPYTMMHIGTRSDFSPPTPRGEINSISSERSYFNEERYELQNGHQRRAIPSGNPPHYQTVNSPESNEGNPRKRHCSEEAWSDAPQYRETAANTPKENVTYKTIEVPLNAGDEIFSHMVACSLSQITDDQEKELLKLEIQKLIYNTRFKSSNGR